MPVLKFFDVKARKGFSTDKYRFVVKKVRGNARYFAVAASPSGSDAWRIVSRDFYLENK